MCSVRVIVDQVNHSPMSRAKLTIAVLPGCLKAGVQARRHPGLYHPVQRLQSSVEDLLGLNADRASPVLLVSCICFS